MKFLKISSKGEMELEAISLIGASTKRGDESTIGMFGSGLKYAVAAILRQGIPFVVFSGTKEIKLTTGEVSFGGKTFNRIYVNGKETSLTDSMGTEDWEGVYPFIREIYSNALDADPNAFIGVVDNITMQENYTSFYIQETPEIALFMKDFDNHFLTRSQSLFTNEKIGEIHNQKQNTRIFRKGILCHKDTQEKAIYSYNLFRVNINESRVLRNTYEAQNEVGRLLESCTNKYILRNWIDKLKGGNAGTYEHDCILSEWQDTFNNPSLVEVILENKYYPIELAGMLKEDEMYRRIALPLRLLSRFIKYAPDADISGMTPNSGKQKFFSERTPSEELSIKVGRAMLLLKETSYKHRLHSEIKFCQFLKPNILGQAFENKIWLSINVDTLSVGEIAKIIIEEQEHLTSGCEDETRSFQNHLFNLFYSELTRNLKTEYHE